MSFFLLASFLKTEDTGALAVELIGLLVVFMAVSIIIIKLFLKQRYQTKLRLVKAAEKLTSPKVEELILRSDTFATDFNDLNVYKIRKLCSLHDKMKSKHTNIGREKYREMLEVAQIDVPGQFKLRQVPKDNSCGFHSFLLLYFPIVKGESKEEVIEKSELIEKSEVIVINEEESDIINSNGDITNKISSDEESKNENTIFSGNENTKAKANNSYKDPISYSEDENGNITVYGNLQLRRLFDPSVFEGIVSKTIYGPWLKKALEIVASKDKYTDCTQKESYALVFYTRLFVSAALYKNRDQLVFEDDEKSFIDLFKYVFSLNEWMDEKVLSTLSLVLKIEINFINTNVDVMVPYASSFNFSGEENPVSIFIHLESNHFEALEMEEM